MQKLSKRSLQNLNGVHSLLIAILIKAITDSPYDFGIPSNGGKRTDQEQKELYAKGRTTKELLAKGIVDVKGEPKKGKVTWTLNSLHKGQGEKEVSYAVDIFAYVNGKASWSMDYLKPIADHLKKVAKEDFGVELQWGYDLWKKDGAHFQLKPVA